MFRFVAPPVLKKVAAAVLAVVAADPVQASLICSWNLDSQKDRQPNLTLVAQAIHQCDLVALQGIAASTQPDALQLMLHRMGGDWAQLPPEPGAEDKAFLFNQDVVRYAGRRAVYAGPGQALSARFNAVDSVPFVMASLSPRSDEKAPYDLSSLIGHLKDRYPEDYRNWVISGQVGGSPNDVALENFRRSARPLVRQVDTTLPSASLETQANGVRSFPRAEKPAESTDQIWIPIGAGIDVRDAGAIDYIAAIEALGGARMAPGDAMKAVSPYLPVYAFIGDGRKMAKPKAPILISSPRQLISMGAP